MHLGRHPGVGRVFVTLIVCAGAVTLAARHQPAPPVVDADGMTTAPDPAPQAPRLSPDQQAYNAATRVTDPAGQLAALAKVRSEFPNADIAGEVGTQMLTVLLANFPERTAEITKAVDQAVAGIPRTATADVRLSTIQGLANRLAEKRVALGTIEPLLAQAYAAFDPVKFAAEQKAMPAEGRPPVTQADLASRIRRIRSGALETMGAVHLAMGDTVRAEGNYKDALAANPWSAHAPLALAEMAVQRHDDKNALGYYMLAELSGHLKAPEVGAMRALYVKQHGNESGLSAALDQLYREKFPNPIAGVSARINRTVLAELFTGTGCSPCVAADLAWDKLIEHYGPDAVAMLEFHANIPQPDPMVAPGGDARRLYYKVPGVPTIVVDGARKTGGGVRESAATTYTDYVAMIDKALAVPAQAAVRVQAAFDGRTVTVNASASNVPAGSKDLRLHVVLAEREVHYTGENGVRFHTYVVRSVAAPKGEIGTGFPIVNASGAVVQHTFNLAAVKDELRRTLAAELASRRAAAGSASPDFRADAADRLGLDPSALVVIAFVQDASKHVLQAARVDIGKK